MLRYMEQIRRTHSYSFVMYRGWCSRLFVVQEQRICIQPIRGGKWPHWLSHSFTQRWRIHSMDILTAERCLRKLLLEENKNTYTLFAGDLISPSALSRAEVDEKPLRGRQMIQAMNTVGLDFITFGNHAFDYNDTNILERMAESNFTWISTNVFEKNSNKSYSTSVRYKLLTVGSVRILIFGLTIYVDKKYVRIVDTPSLTPYVKQFLQSISQVQYDVLVALTHLNLETDVALVGNVSQINLVIGGHEHQNYYQSRGDKNTPISKADANAFSVYIHRCAFNVKTNKFRVYSTLAMTTDDIRDDSATANVTTMWYNLAMEGFEKQGFHPNRTISCLPDSVELDGRFSSVRRSRTLLSNFTCECMLYATASNRTIVGAFDAGSIRIDDVFRGVITEYDALRVLPYANPLYSLSVPGLTLAKALYNGTVLYKGRGYFVSYCGDAQTTDGGTTWFINGEDISKTGRSYNVATMDYAREHIGFNGSEVTITHEYTITQTQSLIQYLPTRYSPC